MTSNLGRYPASSRAQDLASAYEGEVPPPFYWQLTTRPLRRASHHHPGAIEMALPYAALPAEFLLAAVVSIDQLDELMERRARREEFAH